MREAAESRSHHNRAAAQAVPCAAYVITLPYVHVTTLGSAAVLLPRPPRPLPRTEKLEPAHKPYTHHQNAQALPHMPPRRKHSAQDACHHRRRGHPPPRPSSEAAAVPAATPRQGRPRTGTLPYQQQSAPPRKHPPDTHEIQGREPLAHTGSLCQHYRSSERVCVEPQGRWRSRRWVGVPGCVGSVGGCEAGRCRAWAGRY